MPTLSRHGRRMGRPPLDGKSAASVPQMIRLPKGMLAALDKIRSSRADRPSRVQVMREAMSEYIERHRRARG